jgi:photosystem II stability/assembly factor-like uncharacterized protein
MNGSTRRSLVLVVATLVVGGGLAAGSGLLRPPEPASTTTPLRSEAARRSPQASASPTSPLLEPPDGRPAEPLTQDVLGGAHGFLATDRIGWAATATGLYRTEDDGHTWIDVRPDGWTASAANALVDANTAYLASDSLPMTMAATHDGGRSWSTATIDDRRIGSGPWLSFQTPMKGFATFFDKRGEPRLRVYATVDGGRTWTGPRLGRIPVIEASLGKMQGPSDGILFMVSGKYDNRPFNNRLVMSLDGGVTWKTRYFPIGGPSPRRAQKWIEQFRLEADGALQIAILADDRGSVWRSRDDGATWQLVKALPRDVEVSGGDFVTPTTWVFELADGTGFRSTVDSGAHWRITKTKGDIRIAADTKTFVSPEIGWGYRLCRTSFGPRASCSEDEDEALVATSDGGRTWSRLGQPAQTSDAAQPASDMSQWAPAGTMGARFGRGPGVAAVVLHDGRVLALGGNGGGADIYEPERSIWNAAHTPLHDRNGQAIALLRDGRVLMAGGSYDDGVDHSSAEIYDPATDRWSWTHPMNRKRSTFDAVTLDDGRVLVAGGEPGRHVSAEIYDPRTSRWEMTGSPHGAGFGATPLIVLKDGRVFRAGGDKGDNRPSRIAEVYDPATGRWTTDAAMTEARAWASATVLSDGRVLVVGGAQSYSGRALPTAELFDPVTNRWTATTAPTTTRPERSATTLADGRVLVVGGVGPRGYPGALSTAELYDPTTDTWSLTAALAVGRFAHAAVRLADGSVLVVGGHGTGWFNRLGSAERYYPNGRSAS